MKRNIKQIKRKQLYKVTNGNITAYLSYGYWPVVVVDTQTGKVYENMEFFSVTTRRHKIESFRDFNYQYTEHIPVNSVGELRNLFPFLHEYAYSYSSSAFNYWYR